MLPRRLLHRSLSAVQASVTIASVSAQHPPASLVVLRFATAALLLGLALCGSWLSFKITRQQEIALVRRRFGDGVRGKLLRPLLPGCCCFLEEAFPPAVGRGGGTSAFSNRQRLFDPLLSAVPHALWGCSAAPGTEHKCRRPLENSGGRGDGACVHAAAGLARFRRRQSRRRRAVPLAFLSRLSGAAACRDIAPAGERGAAAAVRAANCSEIITTAGLLAGCRRVLYRLRRRRHRAGSC